MPIEIGIDRELMDTPPDQAPVLPFALRDDEGADSHNNRFCHFEI